MLYSRWAFATVLTSGLVFAQPHPLAIKKSQFTVAAGGRIVLDAPAESIAFMRSARTRTARATGHNFAVAPELKGRRIILAVPLTTEPGDYEVALSFRRDKDEQTAAVHLTVTPYAQPDATSPTPPVVLLDGIQLAADGSCPLATDSAGTFGNMQKYLLAAPNNVPNVYFFENCAECPECSIEKLGANLGTFLSSLTAPQIEVVAHSMGGLILRSYLAGKSATPGVFNPPANHKIRKAVFLATPHFGSPLADEITTNEFLSQIYGTDIQILEMQRASQFQWDLATWNQFGDDLRGVDAVAVIGNAAPGQQGDGVVNVTSASLEFAVPGRTRVVPYCHISSTDVDGLAGALTGCNTAGIAFIDSTSHPSFQITSSFLLDTAAWQSVGTSAAADGTLTHFGGMMVGQATASGQYSQTLGTVTFGSTTLADGATYGELFYSDFVPAGAGTISLTALGSSAISCGPLTERPGFYSTFRCKAAPAISGVGPLAAGSAKIVASGTTITITGSGFGAQQCASCGVTASGKTLQVSSWSDTQIVAVLPATNSGFVTIGVTAANGSDAINIMATPNAAAPTVSINGVTVQIASAAPGIFTLTGSGSGQAAALNQDYTINGPDHPAPKGSYVTVYFTGGGQTDPPGVTGSVVGLVLKWLTQTVAVTVGNQPVTAQFYGAAPTYVDGLNQLNILLAPNTPSGAQIVVIKVGPVPSPAVATIYVQ